MPDNNSQNWTDDAAFWDEAWADMEVRLDGRKPRKGLFLWVRWGAMLAALLVSFSAAWFFSQQASETPAAISEMVAMNNEQNANDGQLKESNYVAGKSNQSIPNPVGPQDKAEAPAKNQSTIQPVKAPKRATRSAPTALPGKADPTPETQATGVVAVNQSTTLGSLVETPAADPDVAQLERIANVDLPKKQPRPEVPAAVERLKRLPQTLNTSFQIPEITLTKQGSPVPLFIEAQGSLAQGRQTPGFALGVGTFISSRGRFSFPVTLRYRNDLMRLGEGGNGGSRNEAIIGLPFPSADLESNAFEALRLTLGAQSTTLNTSSLELSTGVRYNLSSRFSLNANVSTEYLLSATGVIDAAIEDGVLAYIFADREASNLEFTSVTNSIQATNGSFNSLSGDSGINRFRVRTGIAINYQLFPRLAVSTEASSIVTPTYNSDLLRVRPTQLSFGIRYRLR